MKTHPLDPAVSLLISLLTLFTCKVHAADVFPIATSSGLESGCKAAFDGRNYLVGVQGGPLAEGLITARLISPDGALVRAVTVPAESGGMPQVGFDGTNYLMVWAGSPTTPGFNGQFVNKSGDLLRPVLRISSGRLSTSTTATSLAYGGGRYLVCWSDNTRIHGQLVNPDGTLFGPSFSISGSVQEPRENAIAFDGANFFVVFNGGIGTLPSIYGQFVSPQGGLNGGPEPLLIDNSPDPSDNPLAASFDGTNYLVVFNDEVGGVGSGGWHVFGRLVSKSGTVSSDRLTLAKNPGAQRFPFSAFDGSNYLVAWGDGADPAGVNVVLRFFDRAGKPVGPEFSPFTPQVASRPMFGSPLFDGTRFLVTAVQVGFTSDQDIASADVYGTFVSPSLPPPVPFTWTTNNGAITLTQYTGSGGAVTIPDEINGLPVTGIGFRTFHNYASLTNVVIPDSITSIESEAFWGCTSLTKVTIVNANVVLGYSVFTRCDNLPYVRIGNGAILLRGGACDGLVTIQPTIDGLSVTHLGDGLFSFCTNLTDITIPNSVTSIGGGAFYSCASLTSVTIPDNVTHIGSEAFWGCTSLTSVTIPTNVTRIGGEAFCCCTNLISLTIGNSVTSIGGEAFERCTSLSYVTIPNSVTDIGTAAFADCTSLTALAVATDNPVYTSVDGVLLTRNQTALIQCPAGKAGSYAIPESVTSIGEWAFSGCGSLTSVAIPNSVTSIRKGAFSGCGGLTSIILPTAVTSLEDYVFGGCGGLTKAVLGNGVTRIGAGAFRGCTSLASVTIPDSVTNLSDWAFAECANLAEVYFQGDAPAADSDVFQGANNAMVYYLPGTTGWGATFAGRPTAALSPSMPFTWTTNDGAIAITKYTGAGGAVTIPAVITELPVISIGYAAFGYCRDLATVTIPGSVTNVEGWAFLYCTSLTNITIPKGVVSIGDGAFSGCWSLVNLTIPESVTHIGDYAFQDCGSLEEIAVDPLNSYYSSVAEVLFNKSETTLILYPASRIGGDYAIPAGVTSIGPGAFRDSRSLTNVSIPNSVTNLGSSAFLYSGLTRVTIPKSVVSIGDGAFRHCSGLREITVDGLSSYYSSVDGVLFDKGQKTLLVYPAGKAESDYSIPNSVTHIGADAFNSCAKLTHVTIPTSVTGIDDWAFAWCSSLTSIRIPDSVTRVGDGAFDACMGLVDVTIGGSVGSVGHSAFNSCSSLTKVIIPGSVTNLGDRAFSYCSSLGEITVDDRNPSYRSIAGVLFDKNLKTLMQYPAAKADVDYTIPGSVISVESAAFLRSTNLASITVPNRVTRIGYGAFDSCRSLAAVYFQGDAPAYDALLFYEANNATVYWLPGTEGWGETYSERPTAPWVLPYPVILTTAAGFGIQTNGFGFTISWATNIPVLVEASTTLAGPAWSAVSTNSFANGTSRFTDPHWTNHAGRFYRVRPQ